MQTFKEQSRKRLTTSTYAQTTKKIKTMYKRTPIITIITIYSILIIVSGHTHVRRVSVTQKNFQTTLQKDILMKNPPASGLLVGINTAFSPAVASR